MNTLLDIAFAISPVSKDPHSPILSELSKETRRAISPSKHKDLGRHADLIAVALGAATPAEVPVHQLTHQAARDVERYLKGLGRSESLQRNCANSYNLIRRVGTELEIMPPSPTSYEKPCRNRLTAKDAEGNQAPLRPKLRAQVVSYGCKCEDLPETLRDEMTRLHQFYTTPVVLGRRRKAIRQKTWAINEERIRRFFGALAREGVPIDNATMRDFIEPEKLAAYCNFFLKHNGALTHTLRDVLVWAANVALNYFKDREASAEIWAMINQMPFVRVKDIDQKIQNVTADDLYHVGDQVYQHALAYEQDNFSKQPSAAIRNPQAMTAFHYGRALIWALASATWLRKENLFRIEYGKHIYLQEGKLWFRFSGDEMKGGVTHNGQVRDLWRGESQDRRILEVLERYLELRPHLVERFLKANPGQPEPRELFLTKVGTPFSANAAWQTFSSLSRQYLSAEKEIGPHNIRHIIPSYLLLRHGYTIFSNIQALLGHRSSQTTKQHYLRVKRLFSADMTQKTINAQRDQEKMAERLFRIESMLDNALGGHERGELDDIRANLRELMDRTS